MEGYLILLTAMLLMVVEFCMTKIYQKRMGIGAKAVFLFNVLCGAFAAGIFFCINGFAFEFSFFSLLLAAVSALSSMLYNLIAFRMLRDGKIASYTLFLMTGGMILPYLFGAVVLSEPLSVLRVLGIFVVLAGMIFSCSPKELPNKKYLLLGICVFVLNGMVGMVTKIHSLDLGYRAVSSAGFVLLSNLTRMVISGAALLIAKKQQEASEPLSSLGRVVPLILVSAGAGGLSFLLQLVSAKTLPATVLYPVLCGGSILFSALAGRVFFREKLSVPATVGSVLCFAGMLMFL